MEHKNDLTNEGIKKKFKSQFELVGYAIKLAENMIKTGRSPRAKSETENPAQVVLVEIEEGVDRFEEIPKEKPDYESFADNMSHDGRDSSKSDSKAPERKRTRKILVD